MKGVDVLAVMAAAHDGSLTTANNELWQARAAVAELIKCCDVTVRAFEALGRTNSIVDQLEAHRNCERALIEQKAALAMTTGAAA